MKEIHNSLIDIVHSLETPFQKDDIKNVDRKVLEDLIISTYDKLNEILVKGVDWWEIDTEGMKWVRNQIFGLNEK